MDKFVEPIEDTATVAERVSKAIKEAHEAANVDDKLKLLEDAADILINNDQSAHLLDSFCEEMLEFVDNPQFTIKCFVVSFIQRACLRDPEVTKKAITTLSALLSIDRQYPGASRIIRRVIIACTNIYPSIIQWAVRKKTDLEAGACWEAFSILKGRILQLIDNDNEGVRTVTLKFLETIVLAQSPGPVRDDAASGMEMISLEEKSRHELVSLTDVPRDHRFISYRKLQIEADENFKSLLNQFTLMHLSAQNLLVLINVVCNIAKLRSGWEKTLERIMDALEVLHVNLPPTLGTSQVKSVRKELKFHLFRLLKMPAAVVIQQKLVTLLTDLGASTSEINRNLPPNSAMLPKRSRRGEAAEEAAKRARVEAKIEDDEYPDESAAGPSTSSASPEPSQLTAIDVTAQWIYERLNPQLVTNLVLISLVTFPEEMPAMFASSYTPIAAAGTENQKKHLARMMATQATQAEIGPGFEQMKAEKLKRMQDRIEARKQGAVIAPTPYVNRDTQPEPSGSKKPEAKLPLPTFTAPKPKQQFNLVSSVQKMTKKEMSELFDHLYHRIMGAERRAIQGGAIQQQNLLLVILASRFQSNDEHFEDLLINYIIEEHKQRTELALLYLTEIYAQYQGFSHIHIPLKQLRDRGMSKSQLYERYDRILCKMLKNLTVRDLHRETIFHKLLLESPTVTPNSVVYLKVTCLHNEFSALGLTTLRELILTRNRQRLELIDLLFSLGFHDKPDKLRQSVVDIVKELWELSYLREDIRNKLREQIECCTLDVPPRHFQTLLEAPNKWTENIYRNALHLYLALLQIDTTLLMPLAVAYAKGPIEFKRIVLRLVEPVVKTIGVQNQEMLDLVAECPLSAETLILRFVHLITERNPPTRELVDRVRSLHATRNTDARGMIPILSGLDREDIVNLLPHFVLNSSNQKFVQVVIKRLLTGKNPDTLEPTITGEDLIFEYHKLEPREEEERKMHVENLSELLDSRHIQKDHIAAAIEKILELDVVPPLFYHTLTVVDKKFPSLDSFISNVVQKVILRELWKANDETRKAFFRSVIQLRSVAYAPMLTEFRGDEFLEFVEYAGNQIILDLRDFYPTLSASQRRSVATEISDKVRDKDAEEKQRLKAGKDGKGSKENKEKEKDKDKEREDDRENQEQEREAMRESRRNKEQQKEMNRQSPEPLLVLTRLRGGVSCICILHLNDSQLLAIGTSSGILQLYNSVTYLLERTLYEDPEQRAIQSVGNRKDGEGKQMIWAFVRGFGILQFNEDQPIKLVSTDFVGFARAVTFGADLIYPVTDQKSRSAFRITKDGDWGKSELLYQIPVLEKSDADDCEAISPEMTPLCCALYGNLFAVGDDAGRIHLVDLDTRNVQMVRHVKTPIFAIAGQQEFIAFGTEKSPLALMELTDKKDEQIMEVQYPSSSEGCSFLGFSPSGKTLLSGFWDGSVRVYSMKSRNLLLHLHFHKASITCLHWSRQNAEDRILIASRDETLSIWKFDK